MSIALSAYSSLYLVLAFGFLLFRHVCLLPRLTLRQHWLLALPAALLHELAHFIPALLLLGRPTLSLKMERNEQGGCMGWGMPDPSSGMGFTPLAKPSSFSTDCGSWLVIPIVQVYKMAYIQVILLDMAYI